jgi:hypothetical protein
MKDEKIRRGATFEVTLTDSDLTAETATITVSNDTGIIEQDTKSYTLVDGVPTVTLTIQTADMEVGEYEYMYTVVYPDGIIEKLPDIDSCDEAPYVLPKFIVCEANDIVEV